METVTVRIEDHLKAQAEDVLARHGVSPTEAVNHLYLYVAQHSRLPFRVRPVSESPEDVYRSLLQQAACGQSAAQPRGWHASRCAGTS
ncbi:type II toxin-antitoxin system RelB/DinJ family antitoxin [Pantoea sp. KXB25]|uniref:type II toxin-antitoxin system RelB/DinJ family antitoxin n=1 Tax=unclassified Pantoea TaxID=2630326 RepID=UPI003AB77751